MHCLKFTLWRWRNIPGTTDGQFLVIRKGKHICGVLKPWTNLVENSSEMLHKMGQLRSDGTLGRLGKARDIFG